MKLSQKAYKTITDILEEFSEQVDEKRREEIEEALRELEAKLAKI